MRRFGTGGACITLTAAACSSACGKVSDAQRVADASIADTSAVDALELDASSGPALGDPTNPAASCAALRDAGRPSGLFWVTVPGGVAAQVYCEQGLGGGGWALLENSVRHVDGSTTAFWQFKYADRLKELGTVSISENYYNGALYQTGREFMDVFVDLQDHAAVAAVVLAGGFDPDSMRFKTPTLTQGNSTVFSAQFAAGWSSSDFDNDDSPQSNCAASYGNVAQHYAFCFSYNLGVDEDDPILDNGVGPHVSNAVLSALGLSQQPASGSSSQVKRISRFVRW